MSTLRIAVLGAGMSGLSAALALGRAGHDVTLIERDAFSVGEPQDASTWARGGIPHFLQPHAFIPRGRKEMRGLFPDVFSALMAAGAYDVDASRKIPGPAKPGDEDFAYLAARRPLIEWALRRAVVLEPGVRVLSGVQASGFEGRSSEIPRVTGVLTTAGSLASDLVVDAMGRRTSAGTWIQKLGGAPPEVRTTECGILYYGRYYKVRPGQQLPDGNWILGPRGDLGYGAFSTFPGDNGTFASVIGIAPGDQELKALRHASAFDAASAAIPALHSWSSPATAEPLTGVLPMGSLQNSIRGHAGAGPAAIGLIGVGDTICHTDPALALGLTFSLIHARALVAALDTHASDMEAAAGAFDAAVRPDIEERFRFSSEMDESRTRMWAGKKVNFGRRDGGAYALFTVAAGGAASLLDSDVFRRVVSRNSLLEPLGILDEDEAMLSKIETLFTGLVARGGPRPGPEREELLGLIRAAAKT